MLGSERNKLFRASCAHLSRNLIAGPGDPRLNERQCIYPQHTPPTKRGKREYPTRQAGTASRRNTVCPADPSTPTTRSQVHHSAKTTGAISAQSTAPISKAHLPLSTRECELSHRARLMARKGSAKLFWQPTQKAGEGGGDHTGDAEPGTGPGLGRSSPGDLAPRAVEPDGAAAPRGRCGKYRL